MGSWSPGPAATAGNDTFVGDATSETADGLAGDYALSGNAGDDALIGGDGDDFIAGGAGDDTLTGGAGDDDLYQMAASRNFSGTVLVDGTITDWGNDVIDGGAGFDHATLSFADRSAGLIVDVSDPAIVSQFAIGGVFAGSATGVERFTITGTDFGDTITTGDGDDLITPGLGNDSIFAGGGGDWILAGVTAANESNHFDGGAGTDSISYYAIGPSAVVIDLENGVATVGIDQPVHDVLVSIENAGGTWQNDDITGSDGANVLFGDNGDDVLRGLGGDDTLITDGIGGSDQAYGGQGDDLYIIASAAAQVIELADEGVDTVHLESAFAPGSIFDFSAFANVENFETTTDDTGLTLIANGMSNVIRTGVANFAGPFESYSSSPVGAPTTIYAGAGNDSVFGDAAHGNVVIFYGEGGDDDLHGGDGADILIGGAGADLMDGGAGADTASYAASSAGVSIDLLNANASGGDAQGDILTSVENLVGSALNDTLTGDNGANVLTGGDGDDILIGGADKDVLDGGRGVDTLSYEGSVGGVTVRLWSNTATGGDANAPGGGLGHDTIINF
jgi:Ca2+-binding RTX toxin-like protein